MWGRRGKLRAWQRARRANREQTCAGDRRIMTANLRRIIGIMTNMCGQVSIHASRVGRDGERVPVPTGARRRTGSCADNRGRGWFQFTRPAWGATRGEAATLRARARARAGGEGAKQLPSPCVFCSPRGLLCVIFGCWRGWLACYATLAGSLARLAAARLAAMRSRSLARLASSLSGLRAR